MELNPNNKVVRTARDHWHKIAAMIMVKLGKTELDFTIEDVNKIAAGNVNIVLDARDESKTGIFKVRIVDDKTAAELARQEGGRPQDC
jgi:N-glycosylase/DNA lyase